MTTTDATRDYVSIGCLCGQLQHSVRAIERAAAALGIVPAMRLNGIAPFDGGQAERIAERLRETVSNMLDIDGEPGGGVKI